MLQHKNKIAFFISALITAALLFFPADAKNIRAAHKESRRFSIARFAAKSDPKGERRFRDGIESAGSASENKSAMLDGNFSPAVNTVDYQADLIVNRLPAYPLQARRLGQEGVVRIAMNADNSGRVTASKIEKSSGHRILDDAALDCVSRWDLSAVIDHIHINTIVRTSIKFMLENK